MLTYLFYAALAFQAFLVQSTRLMTAMLRCELLVNSMTLGKLYAVINKRNGKILKEEMKVLLFLFWFCLFFWWFFFVCVYDTSLIFTPLLNRTGGIGLLFGSCFDSGARQLRIC